MENLELGLIKSFILINQFFQTHNIRYCLIGGVAAGFWGKPRYTQDLDFTVVSRTGSLDEIIELLKKDKFKIKEKGPSQLQVTQKDKLIFQVDIILAETDYQDWVVQRAKPVDIFEAKVPICSPEDLIILKLIANRRQDLVDIENILNNKAVVLDKNYLKHWFSFWELHDRFSNEFGKEFSSRIS